MNRIDLTKLENMYQSTQDIDKRIEIDGQYRVYLENKLLENPRDIQSLINLGIICWEPFHEEDKAINCLETAIKIDPKNVDARFWLAKCLYHDYCAYGKAKQILLEALKIDSKRSDCLYLLAEITDDISDDLNEAIHYLEKAIIHAQDWPSIRLFLGSLYLKAGQIKLAEQEAKQIEELAALPLRKPKNAVEDYYETIVTGRSYGNLIENLGKLKENIQKIKSV